MFLYYVDESGSPVPYRKRGHFAKARSGARVADPLFVLGMLIVYEPFRPVITDYFENIQKHFFGRFRPQSEDTEIKGRCLRLCLEFKRRGAPLCRDCRHRGIRGLAIGRHLALINSVFDLAEKVDFTLYVMVVDQEEMYSSHGRDSFSAQDIALTFLQQKAALAQEYTHGRTQQGIFIMDRHDALAREWQQQRFRKVRDHFNRSVSWAIDFDSHLVEQPVQVDSHVVYPIQLADVFTYAVAHAIRSKGKRRYSKHPWFRRVEPILARRFGSDEYEGAGLAWYRP